MEIKYDMFQGLRIIDTVYTNAGGFFTHLANTSGIKCRYISLEAKNYRFDLKNPEFDQISSRLIDAVGQFGFLVCRSGNRNDVKKHCESILADNNKHVIVLTDDEITYLLDLRADSDTDGINDFMDNKIRSLRFRSKK